MKWTKEERKEGAEGEGEIGSRVDKEQEEGKIEWTKKGIKEGAEEEAEKKE